MPIQILPARLANQIAAGEVVERPASVVKELVENSIDAGATRIDIDIEKGGSRLIRIRDNGKGIAKDELGLALSRHATSKIASLDDLEAIVSLGFRGEALASISSVSRLTLTSRTEDQAEAWSAYAEGRDMEVQLKPAAHPVGTTLEVLDLFFNTPARRKFLRTEKTEFTHIDELIKRIALSRFDVAITLRHNGKLIRQYRIADNPLQQERRLAAACGPSFLQHALVVELAHGDLKLSGWICSPQGARSQNDIQYCYVNGRMMKDKLINHAIRQAYEASLRSEQYAAYVLYIEVDPHQVDVNVHPAKHEVRFHQARLVHDFIYQALQSALQQGASVDDVQQYQAPVRASAHAHPEVTTDPIDRVSHTIAAMPDYPNKAPSESWLVTRDSSVPTPTLDTESEPVANDNKNLLVNSVSKDGQQSYSQKSSPKLSPQSAARDRQQGSATTQYANASSRHYGEPGPTAAELKAYQQLITTDNSGTKIAKAPLNEHAAQIAEPRREWPLAKQPAAIKPTKHRSGNDAGLGKALVVVDEQFLLLSQQHDMMLLHLPIAEQLRYVGQLQLAKTEGLKPQPLLIPLAVPIEAELIQCAEQHGQLLKQLGIQLKSKGRNSLIILSVCMPLRQQNLQQLIPNLLIYLHSVSDDPDAQGWDNLLFWLAKQCHVPVTSYTLAQAIQLITELEQLWGEQLMTFKTQLVRPVDMQAAIEAFK
ncbi:DNA mismatch repair protein MutL [Photobacterium kishitanii]|uniref:DNA mismatch repair protein MutL n=1 Tax=Photobacterium kishitanii TaxID=318456 RepID=A0AAX0YR13_9GAMM|nr:DNA mismatch repair endonuclease MutL [Photobacterium kishitanii]KJG55809.1 DNA mismatch repair protein MutL [Photobacterium kishitanii]KJG58825.1 DNA mismatch repair protein MutL [Photobacterium kishitanii]KJG67693.1 DNA mismatch repair protein MutL [Photobacterium kishitanii]PSX17203.1 DNA mismatch repair endonuclease MutL [Photobacterium kishitanii]PSX25732.1 DNA mismatch repair endonuclease MutL [Photobacterium kishitanii]